MLEDFLAYGEDRFPPLARQDFPAYLARLDTESRGVDLPEGIVPQTTFWLADQTGRLFGLARLRHRLTPFLLIEGGNIGYAIRPAERRKGFGTAILRLVLPHARALGLERVLVTCDTDNTGSRRIIEKNGGVLDGYAISPDSGKQISRYWI